MTKKAGGKTPAFFISSIFKRIGEKLLILLFTDAYEQNQDHFPRR